MMTRQAELGDRAPNGGDKIDTYKWNRDLGPMGEQRYIPKTELHVPAAFQRELLNAKVLRIASSFQWTAFAVLVVMRWGRKLWILDGQHRWAAAMKRSDITDLPCIVYDGGCEEDGAAAFFLINCERWPLRATERYKARIVRGEPIALRAKALIDEAGWTIGDSKAPGVVRCIAQVLRLAERRPETLTTIWPVVRAIGTTEQVSHNVLMGLAWLEDHRSDETESIASRKWSRRIAQVGHAALFAKTRQASALHGGGERSCALGIQLAINNRVPAAHQFRLKGE